MYSKQCEVFLSLVPQMINFFQNLESTTTSKAIITLLTYYPPINSFLRKTKIIDKNLSECMQQRQRLKYLENIQIFKNNLKIC